MYSWDVYVHVQVASAKLPREEKEPVKQKVAKPSYNQDLPGNYLLVVYSVWYRVEGRLSPPVANKFT